MRCNLQIEGTGLKPEDVLLDAGADYAGDGPKAKPGSYTKHVVMRVDRADGFVGRNFLTRGATEHGFYNEEVDGVLLDKVKFFWAADYGHLSFTSDHNLIKNCEGFGAGDAVIYPGASPETGEQTSDFYPDGPRDNTVVKKCDMHGSALGYSGSMGNAVRITDNHIYGNMTGISSDTLSSAGHPGFPADSSEIDHNYIYSNNLDLYRDDAPVDALVGVPIGTGVIYRRDEQRQRPPQLDLRQLAGRRDDVLRAGFVRQRRRRRGRHLPGPLLPGRSGERILDLVRQPSSTTTRWVGRRRGSTSPSAIDKFGNVHSARQRRRPQAERERLLVGRALRPATPGTAGIANTGRRRDRGERDRTRRGRSHGGSGPAGAPVRLRHQRRQQRRRQAQLSGRMRERARRGHRPHGLRLVAAAGGAGQRSRGECSGRPSEAAEAFEDSPEARALERRVAELTR